MLPLVKKYGAAVVAISNDETGISEDPDVRFEVAKKIVQRAADYGIPVERRRRRSARHADRRHQPGGRAGHAPAGRLQTELKVNTTCGASNVSFGLPARDGISAAFLTMAIGAGMTSAIINPMHLEIVKACMGADVMMGHDPDCARWISRFREAPALQAGGGAAAAPRRARPAGGARADIGGAPKSPT